MTEDANTQNPSAPDVADPEAILVGIDGSKASRNALRWAIGEAKALGRSIRLVGAYTIPSVTAATIDVSYVPIDDTAIRASVTATLKEAAAEVKAADIPVEAVIEIGDAAGVLVEESKAASLAVVGSRGRGGFAGRLLGTVSSALPAHSACPTVVIPVGWTQDGERAPKQTASRPIRHYEHGVIDTDSEMETVPGMDFSDSVVVGVDSLGKDSPALWEAASLAAQRGTPLHMVGVTITAVVGPEWLPSTGDMRRFIDESSGALIDARDALNEKHPDLTVRWTLFDGQPAEVLVRASDTADVLVIGSRGRGGFAGLLLGSTSQSVLPYAKCPTMVVRVSR